MNIKFIKTLVQSNHFMRTIKFLKLQNLFRAYSQSSELKQIIIPFLQCQNLDTSAFLQQNEIQSQIDDDIIVLLTKQKDNISYISPDTFINVKYGFNLLLQQKCIDFDEKLLYFLNTSFQKSLSGTSFYEVYQYMRDQTSQEENHDYGYSMDKDLFNIVRLYKFRNEFFEQQIEKFISYKDPVQVDTSRENDIYQQIMQFLNDPNVDHKSRLLRYNYLQVFQDSEIQFTETKLKNQKCIFIFEKEKRNIETENQNSNKLSIGALRSKGFKDYQRDKEKFILQFSRHTNHLYYLIHQFKMKKENIQKQETRQIYLLDFIENLNLKNNSFFNYSGLNNYITNHITPWLKLNNGISKIKEKKNLRSTKVVDEDNASKDKTYSKLVAPDHKLDDEILFHLLFIIEQDLNNLRSIELIGLNVSDLFAYRLSNVLSNNYKLQKLMLLDLSNNRRLTSYGMKYIYSSIVKRVKNGLNIILTSNQQELESIKLIIEEIYAKINLIQDFLKKRNEANEQKSNINTMTNLKNNFQILTVQKKGSLEILDDKAKLTEQQEDQFEELPPPPNENQNEEDKLNQEMNPDQQAGNNEVKDNNQEVALIRVAAPKQKEQQIDNLKLYGWKNIEDPLQEELNYLKQKYDKYLEIYKECQRQVVEQGEQVQIEDVAIVVQNLASLGFYESINRLVARRWNDGQYFLVISLAIIMWLFTILQFTLYLCFQLQEYLVKKYELFHLKSQSNQTNNLKNQLEIKVTKKVPLILQQEDFYFDEDILMINNILGCTSYNIEENEERSRLLRVKNFLQNPWSQNKQMLSKAKDQKVSFYTLKFIMPIIYATYFTYLVLFIIISTCLQIYTSLQSSCTTLNIYWDIAFYVYCILAITAEAMLCLDVQYIVGSKRICSISYFSLTLRLFFSFILKYDQYTDIQFSIFLYNCNQFDFKDLGIIQACFILTSLFKDFASVSLRLYQLYKERSEHDYEKLPNTHFINIFADLSIPVQMNALSKLLEKFSTIASSISDSFIIPSNLRKIRVPIDFFPRIWRISLGNIPTIVIYFYIYLFKKGDFSVDKWSEQRIFITSIMSFCYCVHQAWVTKPSNYTSFQMKDNVSFVSEQDESYQLKIKYDNKITYYQYDEISKKLKLFIEINPPIFQQNYQSMNKQKLQQEEQKNNNNNIPIESQKNLPSQTNLQSGHDLYQNLELNENPQQPDMSNLDSKSKDHVEQIKKLDKQQSEDFNNYKHRMLKFLIYKKLNWEQFNQRGLLNQGNEKEEQQEFEKKTSITQKEEAQKSKI